MAIDDKRLQRLVSDAQCRAGCTCGQSHPRAGVALCIGDAALQQLAADARHQTNVKSVMVLDDADTHEVAGKDLAGALSAKKLIFRQMTLDRRPTATDQLAGRVAAQAAGHDLVVAVGAGTVNDLAKYAATQCRLPYWTVPTAPSMNGYTSAIAAIKVDGVKRTLAAHPPERVYACPAVIERAPLNLRQAGFCDILAKSVSDIDWQCESMLFSGGYCGLPSALLADIEPTYARSPEAIGRGDKATVMALFKALLISGVAMSLAGSSAPASGGEHLVSHFWDMREALTGRRPELHGLQVGAGIVLSAACYKRLTDLVVADLKVDAHQVFDADAARIDAVWGDHATAVARQFNGKRAALLALDSLLPRFWKQLAVLFAKVPPPEHFVDLFRRTGYPFDLTRLGLDADEFLLAARSARTIRDRLTVLDLAAHAGVLEDAVRHALTLLA